ncbi:MAG: prepilin-type N-terminal cleavage/methylation domain-containing protein [Mycoplasmatota bacterium]
MKKGFTLIELLAVLVILVVIAAIATPIVMGIINDSKTSSDISTVNNMLDTAEHVYAQAYLSGEIDDLIGENLLEFEIFKMDNEPENGSVSFDSTGNTTVVLYNNGNCYVKKPGVDITYGESTLEECSVDFVGDSSGNGGSESTNSVANAPVLGDLIPVTIAANGTVTVVEPSTKWYDYDNQEWANAIVLSSGTASTGDTFSLNDSGTYDNIDALFVWIPRYEYQIPTVTDTENPPSININFVSSSTTNASQDYIMHPAFTFGEAELDGIWVGKFEVTGTIATLTTLPNVSSLRDTIVSDFYDTILNFSKDHNLSNDSHLLKNIEWGAVAYLSHSAYGNTGEIYINNNSSYITGCGGDTASESESTSCKNAYGSKNDNIYNQSTTGNISGIFDMSGGASEYVMGNSNYTTKNSGFADLSSLDSKYIDIYTTESASTAYIEGDATYETFSWYSDYPAFIYWFDPWCSRGYSYNGISYAGIFMYGRVGGGGYGSVSSRMVFVNS